MYCGNCLRDNALVTMWRRQGHQALMVPLYLPLTLDETDASAGTPLFFSGLNVYLDETLPWFRRAPAWLRHWFTSPALLRGIARFAAKTRAAEVGELTLSMLRGEHGRQARDLDELVAWLRAGPKPDVLCLSNALLLGLASRIKRELGVPVVCLLAGEDAYIDAMPEPARSRVWSVLADCAASVALFIAPSRYFAQRMGQRLGLALDRVRVVPPGIDLAGFPSHDPQRAAPMPTGAEAPVLGYFARLCRDKGLGELVEAFIILKQAGRVPTLRLKAGGSCSGTDRQFVRALRARLGAHGLLADAEFHPNLDRAAKLAFLRSLTVFSVPAMYGEAFGLYLLEAWAAGVPVVQPRTGAFVETVETAGGGLLCAPGEPRALAEKIECLLLDPALRRQLGDRGRRAVQERYRLETVAPEHVAVFAEAHKRACVLWGGS
jgi:glycosyltransferase involved in cell wall biosynthesis